MRIVTKDGVRIHDSIRQHGGPETAARVLVVGHVQIDKDKGYASDLFHLPAPDARQFQDCVEAFLQMDTVRGGGARRTSGDAAHEEYAKTIPSKERPKPTTSVYETAARSRDEVYEAPTEASYRAFSANALLDAYEGTTADFYRYSIHEDEPTWREAARRLSLVKDELRSRFGIKHPSEEEESLESEK